MQSDLDFVELGLVPEFEIEPTDADNIFKYSQIYINQIRRVVGVEPINCKLELKEFASIKSPNYFEVVCYYNSEDEEAVRYQQKLDEQIPLYWDEISKKKLAEG